ncbi:MAG: hypothetical protein JNM59_12960 [Hyphomonadaceae bacterium]|nr:hypothetical protein [Hyphomonadaceae bacterium]
MRRIIVLLSLWLFAAGLASPSLADPVPERTPARPAERLTQPPAAEMQVHRDFANWVQRVSSILERAGAANESFGTFFNAVSPNASRREIVASIQALQVTLSGARGVLNTARQELSAIEPFYAADAPAEYNAMGATMVRDANAYVSNMLDMVALMEEATNAVLMNDGAAFNRIAPRLLASATLLIDGQILTLRSRQQLMPREESVHHSIGAMIALYQGMRALALPDSADRPAQLQAAAADAARWGESGRAALAEQRALLDQLDGRQRALLAQMFGLEEASYQINDRVVALLRQAETDSASGVDYSVLHGRYVQNLANLESEYITIGHQQVALFQQFTQ